MIFWEISSIKLPVLGKLEIEIFITLCLSSAQEQSLCFPVGSCHNPHQKTWNYLWVIYFKEMKSWALQLLAKESDPGPGILRHFCHVCINLDSSVSDPLQLPSHPPPSPVTFSLVILAIPFINGSFEVSNFPWRILTFGFMGRVLLLWPQCVFKVPFTNTVSVFFSELRRNNDRQPLEPTRRPEMVFRCSSLVPLVIIFIVAIIHCLLDRRFFLFTPFTLRKA